MSAPPKPSAYIVCNYAPTCTPTQDCTKCANLPKTKIVQWNKSQTGTPTAPQTTGTANQKTENNHTEKPYANSENAPKKVADPLQASPQALRSHSASTKHISRAVNDTRAPQMHITGESEPLSPKNQEEKSLISPLHIPSYKQTNQLKRR